MSVTMLKTDQEIQKDVLRELDWDPQVDPVEVGVQVEDGIVTLTGTISTYAKKLAAKRAAHRVAGVLDVVNNLVVEIAEPHKRNDQEIAKAVRHALEWDVMVPDQRIHSTVSNGRVMLEGHVDNWADRMAAECAVERLAGVRSVDNQLQVEPKIRVEAKAIRDAIRGALERQTRRETDRISITVRDGLVTLTGTVRSWAEKNAAHNAAACTPGVQRIDDRLEIDAHS